MMDWGYMESSGAMMAIVLFLGLVLLVGFGMALMVIFAPKRRQASGPTAGDIPISPAELEIEMRYARGEIDALTLAQQRAVLRQR